MASLERELDWLSRLIGARFQLYFGAEGEAPSGFHDLSPPAVIGGRSPYEDLVVDLGLGFEERALVILSMAPHCRPSVLDAFFTKNTAFDRRFSEFGGYHSGGHSGFLPTGETALFLLAGEDLEVRWRVQELLVKEGVSKADLLVSLSDQGRPEHEPLWSSLLVPGARCRGLLQEAGHQQSSFGADFPAKQLTTGLEWEDLVLPSATKQHLEDLQDWLQYGDALLGEWGMSSRLRPGYTALFYGPPGTGKTLTASLLGKVTERVVYRVDLSMLVSKWIGETEKNLARIFDETEGKRAILFFDEADSLFGKRVETQSSNDRFANQEVSYLLQRIEDYDGLAILASNLKDNIDSAFIRRFQAIIHFPVPSSEERLRLWRLAFPASFEFEKGIDLDELARRHEISGGVIMNIGRFASVKALKQGGGVIRGVDLDRGLALELAKEGYFFR